MQVPVCFVWGMSGRRVTFDTVYITPRQSCMLTATLRFQKYCFVYTWNNPNTIRHSRCKKATTALRPSLCCFMSPCEVSGGLMGLIIFADGSGLMCFSFHAAKQIIKTEDCC